MKLLTKKEVEKLRNVLVANYIIAEDALEKALFADKIEVKEYFDSIDNLVSNTLCSAVILGVHDEIEKAVFAYRKLKLKKIEEEEE